jgi:hypothetical protein
MFFLKVLKIQSELAVSAVMLLNIFGCLLGKKTKMMVFLTTLPYSKNPCSDPLKEDCSGLAANYSEIFFFFEISL